MPCIWLSNQAVPMDIAESGAFVDTFELEPISSGPLDGLCFAVKDLFDVAGRRTGCGNPAWRVTHPPAVANAIVVDLLLGAGARCVGKTVTDELAFSLIGENQFYGTPLNPRAPDRVPGGSSSGSASAIACGLADFALGTDTGGSTRVPASNCGLVGLRPSHGRVPSTGCFTLAGSFDTVGVLARDADMLSCAAGVLLSVDVPEKADIGTIHVITEAFALAEPEVGEAFAVALGRLRERFGDRMRDTSLREVDGQPEGVELKPWADAFNGVQWAEIWNSVGAWVTACDPEMAPVTAATVGLTRKVDRATVREAVRKREDLAARLGAFLGPRDLLCIPTVHTPAPLKGSQIQRGASRSYYTKALALTAISGVGRVPAVSLPLAEVGGLPVGISLIGARWQDEFLLAAGRAVMASQEVAATVRS